MPRYIDAEKISDLFDVEYKSTKKLIGQGKTNLNNLAEGFFEAYLVIQKMPTADVQEIKHGKFVGRSEPFDYIVRKCNRCASYTPVGNFCMNCGAKMDGK